jgi:hypothetical protein
VIGDLFGGQVAAVCQRLADALDTSVDLLQAAFDEPVGVQQEGRPGRQPGGRFGALAIGGDGQRRGHGVLELADRAVEVGQQGGQVAGAAVTHGAGARVDDRAEHGGAVSSR